MTTQAKTYRYSVLRYRPSYVLGEQVNVGVLLVFAEDNTIQFLSPKHFSRLTALFGDIDLNFVRKYLRHITDKARQLTEGALFLPTQLDTLIASEFLLEDASSFYFTEFRIGEYTQLSKVVEYYDKQYLSAYDDSSDADRHLDKDVLQNFVSKLKEQNRKDKEKLFQRDYRLSERPTSVFDYGWQNGKLNLVKALSFDLLRRDSIYNKGVKWFGELVLLEREHKAQDKRIDFIFQPPQNDNFRAAFEEVKSNLTKTNLDIEIVEENDVPKYVHHALETIKPILL